MDKIIIFKSDMVGDLINFSPCLKIIKDNKKHSHITLVCSNYNYQIAKNYHQIDKFIIFKKHGLLMNVLKNFKNLFFVRYDYLFQFDGKSSSYFISYIIRSRIKSTICFIKHKKIFGMDLIVKRPSNLLLNLFYNNFILCDEKYSAADDDRKLVNYQRNYFNLLQKLNYKITDKKNLFFLDKAYEQVYNDFYEKSINCEFSLFHFDEKWDKLKYSDFKNSLKIINKLSTKYKVIITTGLKKFSFLKNLKEEFNTFNFIENKFISKDSSFINNAILLEKLPLNLLAYFIKNSEINFSFHSGPVVHISPAFNRKIVDLIPKTKNDELDRWISEISNYQRINFEDLDDKLIESI